MRCCGSRGLNLIPHPFADHHAFSRRDLEFGDSLPVLMTEKDAVKCAGIVDRRHWYVPVQAVLSDADADQLLRLADQAVEARRRG